MSRHPSACWLLVATVAATALACCSATAPANLTGPYVGTYTMDSVTASVLAQGGLPHGTLDSRQRCARHAQAHERFLLSS